MLEQTCYAEAKIPGVLVNNVMVVLLSLRTQNGTAIKWSNEQRLMHHQLLARRFGPTDHQEAP